MSKDDDPLGWMSAQRFSKLYNAQLQNAAAIAEIGFPEFAQRLSRCAEEQHRRRQARSYTTYRCQSRYCLFCARRDANIRCKKHSEKFENYSKEGYRINTTTLTIPNTTEISREVVTSLFDNYGRLNHRIPLKNCVVGSLAKLETTFNPKTEKYHPHIHALMIYNRCAPQQRIKEAWLDLTSTEFNYFEFSDSPETDSMSRSTFIKKLNYDANDPASIKQEVRNAIAYLAKPVSIPTAEAFAEYFLATKGRQLIRSYGAVRGMSSANSHYLDKGMYESAIVDEGESPRAKRAGRTSDDAILIAAQRRLVKMRAENHRQTHTGTLSQRAERMPSSVECIKCKVMMPPGDPLCKQCKAELEVSDQNFINLAQSS
jgi:hypothetical protein